MEVTKILKKSKLDRYYKTHTMRGGLAFLDRIFFDDKYFDILLPDELLAVGAHEFTHLNQRHGLKKFLKLIMLPALIGSITGSLSFNFGLIQYVPSFMNCGEIESSTFAGLLSFFIAYLAGLYVNAKWCRQQETSCDLSTVEFLNGEAMISALIKLNNLRPRKIIRIEKALPQLYPTLEQRICDIRVVAENKKKQTPEFKETIEKP